MKHVGSQFEFTLQRDEDLMHCYLEEMSSCSYIKVDELFRRVVNRSSVRFWVSDKRAAIMIAKIASGDRLERMNNTKREMFFELYRRAMKMKKENPELSLSEIAFEVVMQPAPKFYLTPNSAHIIVHNIKKKCFDSTKRRLRFLYL